MSLGRCAGQQFWRCKPRPCITSTFWIGDDFLETVFRDFVRHKGHIRHAGSTPGPLESRKRSTKRRVALNSAPRDLLNLGSDFLRSKEDVSLPNEVEAGFKMSEKVTLPDQMAKRSKKISWHRNAISVLTRAIVGNKKSQDISKPLPDAEALLREACDCTDLGDMRRVLARTQHRMEHVSQKIFNHMLASRRRTNLLLDFLEDRTLNPPDSGNLFLLLNSGKAFRPNGADGQDTHLDKILAWVQMQLNLGKLSLQEIEELSQSIGHMFAGEGEPQASKLVTVIVEGIEACPVLDFADVRFAVVERILNGLLKFTICEENKALSHRFIGALPLSYSERLTRTLSTLLMKEVTALINCATDDPFSQNALDNSSDEVFAQFTKLLPTPLVQTIVLDATVRLVDGEFPKALDEMWWQMLGRNKLLTLFLQSEQGNDILDALSGRPSNSRAMFLQYTSTLDFAQCIVEYWCPASKENETLLETLTHEWDLSRCLPLAVQHVASLGEPFSTSLIYRLFRLLENLEMAQAIESIILNAEKMDYILPVEALQLVLSRRLPVDSKRARQTFLLSQQFLIESHPEMAENWILAKNLTPGLIWTWFDRKRHNHRFEVFFSAQENQGNPTLRIWDDNTGWQEILQGECNESVSSNGNSTTEEARAALLERMAASFAVRQRFTAEPLYFDVFTCLRTHVKEGLGPIKPLMVRALVETGLIKRLRQGTFVPRVRIGRILALVAQCEGKDVADEMEADIQAWCEKTTSEKSVQRFIVPAECEGDEEEPEPENDALFDTYGTRY